MVSQESRKIFQEGYVLTNVLSVVNQLSKMKKEMLPLGLEDVARSSEKLWKK